MKIWGKIWKNNHLLRDEVAVNNEADTRTHRIFACLEELCHAFDLGRPIWLDSNISEFKRLSRTRFTKDSFVEDIDFDHFEIIVLEE